MNLPRLPALLRRLQAAPADRSTVLHSARTAVGTMLALAASTGLALPEPVWAPITTLVVMQSTMGATWDVSLQRLLGTALGAVLGSAGAALFGPNFIAFGVGLFLAGVICSYTGLGRSAYRFAGVCQAIILLYPKNAPPWRVGLHRFEEVSLGIVVALLLTVLWPEKAKDQQSVSTHKQGGE